MDEKTDGKTPAAISALSGVGFLICLYLTAVYYTTGGAGTYCGQGWECDAVLNSRYSKMFGLPASLFGTIGYAALALSNLRREWRNAQLTVALASAGAGVSVYLSWAEFFVIKQVCPFCVASAVIIAVIWILSLRPAAGGRIAVAVLIAALAGAGGYASSALGPSEAVIKETAERNRFQEELALHLKESGAVMYGSFTCPACKTQKRYFGKYAGKLNYVECNPKGKNARAELCREKKVKAFPTWEIDGVLHKGMMTLRKLSKLSGFSPQ